MKIGDRVLEFSLGAIAGEAWSRDHGNEYYLAGWMFAGMIPYIGELGDVRDLCASDSSTVVMNCAAVWIDAAAILLPPAELLSMASSGLCILTKFAAKHPEEIQLVLSTSMLIIEKTHIVDGLTKVREIWGNEVVNQLQRYVSDGTIIDWAKKGVPPEQAKKLLEDGSSKDDVQHVVDILSKAGRPKDLNEVLFIKSRLVTLNGQTKQSVLWLQKGTVTVGLNKITKVHSVNFKGKFGRDLTDQEYVDMIYYVCMTGTPTQYPGKDAIEYIGEYTIDGKTSSITVVVSEISPGRIINSYPQKLRKLE